jgi:hypothetical protein
MFASALRSVARRGGVLARALAVPKKDSSRVEITKPATHPDFTGYSMLIPRCIFVTFGQVHQQRAVPPACRTLSLLQVAAAACNAVPHRDMRPRIMNEDGQIIAPKEDPHLSQDKVVEM